MGATSVYGLRYRELSETPDIPIATKNLADDVEAELARIDALLARRTSVGATVATLETRVLTSYGDLTTVGPSITVVTDTSVIVHISCGLFNSAGVGSYASVAVSGASTQAAVDGKAVHLQNASLHRFGITIPITGLTPGSNTFTMKYRVVSGTGSFQDRTIVVVPN